ncbi:MAG: type III pantothenate kinase [Flavobacteriales bacterium]|nr:type III pantothenate kinase [Flavobacteriales bacterium]
MDPSPAKLVLDIGNSRTKFGVFSSGRLVRNGALANDDVAGILSFSRAQGVHEVVVGTVVAENPALINGLRALGPVRLITGLSPSHLRNAYATPETLGADRWANAVGASLLFPGRAVLAVSLGSCAIYDLVDDTGAYQGGLISPGLWMRARAMHEFTARLPQVRIDASPRFIGRSTAECIGSGAHHGLRAELDAVIGELRQQHPGLAVVLTGGDALRFARALENGIFAHPFLTLYGLHALSLFDRPAARPAFGDPGA